ncbi:transporter substrate-binding domain-containing protein [Microbacterium wangchenii]|uniref:Transporter substrate-binding domain-containing protein n=1 Tax=Microbacterium wangchenii TaxID=2541726 RepID=A0ABX5SVS3_9MICO|nr:transporter substrate-binding domain-containing protein [Microbacterium wangchenii]
MGGFTVKTSLTRRLGAIAVAGIVAASLAACSGGDGGADAGTGDDGGAPEKASLTVAINPSTQFAPLYYGLQEGIFEEHGLELEITPQTDIAAIVSGLASGTYDVGFATVVHAVTANANGIPIRAITSIEGQIQEDDEGTLTIASAESGITDFAGLEGKRVATVGLSSHNTLTMWELVDRAGADAASIELVQLPFGQMAAALESGDVDAAIMQWPFAAEALAAGGVELGYNNRELFEGTATTLFNTSQSFVDQNPNTVRAFADAMAESIEGASADPETAKAALVDGLGITEEQAAGARWNVGGDPALNVDAFEVARDLLVKFSTDESAKAALEKLDVSTIVWSGAL